MGSSHELHLREQVSDKAKLLVCPGSRPMAEPGPGQEAGEESPPHPRPGAGLLGTSSWEPGELTSSHDRCPPQPSTGLPLSPHAEPSVAARCQGQGRLFTGCKDRERAGCERRGRSRTVAHTPFVYTCVHMLRSFCQVPASGELVLTRSLRLSVTITFY